MGEILEDTNRIVTSASGSTITTSGTNNRVDLSFEADTAG